jgi:glutathione synthase/RimK-type ligase-like ATP-grasp enzyme
LYKFIVITDKGNNNIPEHPERLNVAANDFIAGRIPGFDWRKNTRVKIVNMCSNYDYLSKGYYCSLLAEARGMRCIPSVPNMIQLNWKRNFQSQLPELNSLLAKHFKDSPDEPLERTYYVYFGRTQSAALEPIARRIFDMFRFPLMSLSIYYKHGKWEIDTIESLSTADIPDEKIPFFHDSLETFTGTMWTKPTAAKKEKHWIAILQDPQEKFPPSNKTALQKFVRIGKDMNVFIELINKNDYASLLEYDALLIRETTAINHHTYRFADKAEREGIPVIDDPVSIIRCCNKVYLFELLKAHKIPVPETRILDRKAEKSFIEELEYPTILKIPDGSFSRGIVKVDGPANFDKAARELLKKSEIILQQEFVPSDFDWRVGVLNGEPIFACQYFMAKGHWQVYKHPDGTKKGRVKSGAHLAVPVYKVPKDVMEVALKAARLIGDGLYGVDLKQTDNGIYVMEVNDNPNIDHGVEDQVAGDGLYQTVLQHLIAQVEAA